MRVTCCVLNGHRAKRAQGNSTPDAEIDDTPFLYFPFPLVSPAVVVFEAALGVNLVAVRIRSLSHCSLITDTTLI